MILMYNTICVIFFQSTPGYIAEAYGEAGTSHLGVWVFRISSHKSNVEVTLYQHLWIRIGELWSLVNEATGSLDLKVGAAERNGVLGMNSGTSLRIKH